MNKGKSSVGSSSTQRGLTLKLLGHPRIVRDGKDVTRQIKYRKGIALLGYLAAQEVTWHLREHLADLLWPGLSLVAARTNLRQVLNNLAVLLNQEGDLLKKDGAAASLVPHGAMQMDIVLLSDGVLERLALDGPESRSWREREVEPWVEALGGEFLAGLQLPDTPDFDEWLVAKRIQFRTRGILLLEYLCRAQRADGRLAEAVSTARRLVCLAPLDEKHSSLLMSLLLDSGDASGALDAFGALQQRLDSELGMAPSLNLNTLRDDIMLQFERQSSPVYLRDAGTPELRQLVALYCAVDLLRDDEPDNDFIERVESVVRMRGGMVVSTIGRGLLAVFGLGDSAERATQRAVLVGRELLLLSPSASLPRIGICAGSVLLRPASGIPHLVGEIPDVARLIGWSAQAGEILVSEAVTQRTTEWFCFESAGEWSFSGLNGVHKLFRLVGATAANLFDNMPFAGRCEELAQLSAGWRKACSGQANIAVLKAPAGLGKTRLASELANLVAGQDGRVRRIQCSLEHQHQPLAAVLAEMGGGLEAIVQDQSSKSSVFSAVLAQLMAETERTPTLLLVDDLHWSDLATRELLGQLVRGLAHQKLMLVLTTRPEVAIDFPGGITQIFDLVPLDHAVSLAMIAAHDTDNVIPAIERESIAVNCVGIPLFIERQVKSRLDGEHHQLSISELLRSELDQLGANRAVLHAAAVLGSRFQRRHLVALLPNEDVPKALARAVSRRLVEAVSAGTCTFRHALIRDAAYESLPKTRRKLLHERTARLFIAENDVSPEEIAQHFAAAGCRKESVKWWLKAGDAAMAQEFAADAMASFREALGLLEVDGEAVDDVGLVRSLHIRLGYAAQVAEGYGSPLTQQLFVDMVAEIEADPDYDRSEMFSALSGCYMGSSSYGRDDGLVIARRLQILVQSDAERLMACFALGNTLFWRAEFQEAICWQRQGIALATSLPLVERIRYGVDDPAVTCRAFLSWSLWFVGEDAAACDMAEEAVAYARKDKRAHALCFALTFAVGVHWFRGDVVRVAALASESLAVAKQYEFPLWEGVNSLFLLWVQAKSGQITDTTHLFGAANMLQQAIPGRIMTSRWIVASALLAQGASVEAERLLDTALCEIEHQEEQYCLPNLLRLKGLCLAERGQEQEAREHHQRALELASQMGAVLQVPIH